MFRDWAFEIGVSGLEFRVSDFRVQGFKCRVSGFGFSDFVFRVQVQGQGIRVHVQIMGSRV